MRNTVASEKSKWAAQLRSHELHLKLVYGLRLMALALAALTILIGAVMVFAGLQGSFNCAVEAPHTINAKLTNASPGIVFASIGMILCCVVILQKPVNFKLGEGGTLAAANSVHQTGIIREIPRLLSGHPCQCQSST